MGPSVSIAPHVNYVCTALVNCDFRNTFTDESGSALDEWIRTGIVGLHVRLLPFKQDGLKM